jgi:hypothetical protein
VSLHPHAEGCELQYTVHSTVGGKLAQLGQRLIDGAAKSLAEDFFKRFEEALQAKYPAAEGAVPAPQETSASSTTSVPNWVWFALVVGAVGIWSLTR